MQTGKEPKLPHLTPRRKASPQKIRQSCSQLVDEALGALNRVGPNCAVNSAALWPVPTLWKEERFVF